MHLGGITAAPVIGAVVGVGAGLTASVFFRRMTRQVVGRVGDPSMPIRQKQDWSRPGRFEGLMPHLRRFRIPYVDSKALIEATSEF